MNSHTHTHFYDSLEQKVPEFVSGGSPKRVSAPGTWDDGKV